MEAREDGPVARPTRSEFGRKPHKKKEEPIKEAFRKE